MFNRVPAFIPLVKTTTSPCPKPSLCDQVCLQVLPESLEQGDKSPLLQTTDLLSHWVGQPKKMTRDRPGKEAFQDTRGGDFFHTTCPIFDINLLGGFFALGWSMRQDLPQCSFNDSNKNNPTAEPVSSLGLHTEQWVRDKGMGDPEASPQEDGTQHRWWLSHCCGDGAAFP